MSRDATRAGERSQGQPDGRAPALPEGTAGATAAPGSAACDGPGDPPGDEARDPSPSWFRRHFNEDYLTIYAGRNQEQAEREVELVVRELELSTGGPVLDLCCGFGRHLAAFGRRGIRAVGVDLSLPLLRRVPRECSSSCVPEVVCADMRALPFPGGDRGFSAVVNFFTSFGYFDSDEENQRAMMEIARVLRPGGRFAMDLLNAGHIVQNLEPLSEREAGPFLLIERRHFDPVRRRIEKEITLRRKDLRQERHYLESVRIFSEAEIRDVVVRAGLRVDRILGEFDGRPFADGTSRMIILGSRPRPGAT